MKGMDEAMGILREMEKTIARISRLPPRGAVSEARRRLRLIKGQNRTAQPPRIPPSASNR